MIDGELGAFLRARREAVPPERVGLPAGPRRRTPGLRRAELATLAGVSVEYLVRLEQGRDRNPSGAVLAALADALRLDDTDRQHLWELVAASAAGDLCRRAPSTPAVRPSLLALLGTLEPAPAVVLDALGTLLAWNPGYERLVGPIGLLEGTPPNLARYVLTDPRARAAFPDWADVADEQVASLHRLRDGDPATDVLAAELAAAGPEFTARWERRPLRRTRATVTALDHPAVGVLRLTVEPLGVSDADRQQLLVHLPADEATATGLDRLAGRTPGALRGA